MGGINVCGCKEAYIYLFLLLLIHTPLVSALFCSIPTFCSFFYCERSELSSFNGTDFYIYKYICFRPYVVP